MSIYVGGNRLASKLFNAFSDVRLWHAGSRCPLSGVKRTRLRDDAVSACDPKRTKGGLKSRGEAAPCHIVCRHGRGRHSAPPRFRTIQFGPTKCVNNSTDLRCKSGIVCASLVMPTVNLTRILSE